MKSGLRFLVLLIFIALSFTQLEAQIADHIYHPYIHTVKLYNGGDVYSFPILELGSSSQLELHFDDMEGGVKYYYYSFLLCNADWTPAKLQSFDYIRGFQTNRITNYRQSSVVATRYTHYQVTLPERNSFPTKAGNYLLKVFLNDDTSKLVFTKRMLVVNQKATVSARISQPFNGSMFQTHQRVTVEVGTVQNQITTISPQDLKVVILQNNIWKTASFIDRPTLFRGNYYEYSDEDNTTFAAGKEWRWVDLRSLRLRSDRVKQIIDNDSTDRIDVFVQPDAERKQQIYVYYRDLNGLYTIENRDNNNPFWQSDYAWVHFTFIPPGNRAYQGKNVYLFGELVNYEQNEESKMEFNESSGVYEKSLYLKQGYYNYSYITLNDRDGTLATIENTEGNYWGTENNYIALVYYRPFGARADELVAVTTVNSNFSR